MKCRHESTEYQLYSVRGIHRETHHFPGVQINDGSDVDNFVVIINMGEVGGPDVARIVWGSAHEQVGVNYFNILGLFPLSASPTIRFNAEEIHHPLHSFSRLSLMSSDRVGCPSVFLAIQA